MCFHTRTCTSAGTLHLVRGLRVQPFSVTLRCRQLHSVFGGCVGSKTRTENFRLQHIRQTVLQRAGSKTHTEIFRLQHIRQTVLQRAGSKTHTEIFRLQHIRQTVLQRAGSKTHMENVDEETEVKLAQVRAALKQQAQGFALILLCNYFSTFNVIHSN